MLIVTASISILRRAPRNHHAPLRWITGLSSRQIESRMKKLIDTKEYEQVLNLFDRHASSSTDITRTLALKACTKLHDAQRGRKIHRLLSDQSLRNSSIQTSLIHFYSTLSLLNLWTKWSTNVLLVQSKDVDRAHQIFESIDYKTLFMYGAMLKGQAVHWKTSLNRVSFPGYISNGMPQKVLELFPKMTVEPDRVISTLLFNACAKVATPQAIELGENLLARMPDSYCSNPIVMGSAINMLMRFGRVPLAEDLFSRMKKRDVSTYGVMINGFYLNEQPDRCLQLFHVLQQQRIPIDEPIAMSMVGACSQLGIRSTCRDVIDHLPSRTREGIRVKTAMVSMWVSFCFRRSVDWYWQLISY